MTGYTARETAGFFGLKPARVRAMARAGILSPSRGQRREYRFSFQDLVLLRSARTLLDASVSGRRVHRALRLLLGQIPQDRRPSGIRLTADRGRILAHDGTALWSLDSGQTLLDFATEAATPVAALTPVGVAASPAEDWYQHGLDLEPVDREGARAAYEQAVALAPAHVGARINLGRLLQAVGATDRAVEHYQAALQADPGNPTAAFNLGTALEATGQVEEAIAAYRQALRASPQLADAHYNLSCLYQRSGHKLAALVHLKRYRELLGVH